MLFPMDKIHKIRFHNYSLVEYWKNFHVYSTSIKLTHAGLVNIHFCIIQYVNHLYESSFIHSAYKKTCPREFLRVRDGNHDYFDTEEIDIKTLQQINPATNQHKKIIKPFRMDMAYSRKELPKGDS
ncbi:MAG TPA: hypothetical protein DIT85_12765 [Pantoea ananatis]|nr:hypothetical protein [Pantoea ananatis]